MQLYDYFRSSACYRVRIALNLKGLAADLIPVHLVQNGGEQHSDAYVRINPQHLVPTLKLDDGQQLIQSLNIIEYLEETHPHPSLWPEEPWQKAHARSLALMIACDIHPLNNLRVLNYLKQNFDANESQVTEWYQHWIHQGFQAIETLLHKEQQHPGFCIGAKPSVADICLIPQVYNAHRFKVDMSLYPRISAIDKHCRDLAAFVKAAPER